jgi:hypothetical protein
MQPFHFKGHEATELARFKNVLTQGVAEPEFMITGALQGGR